MALASSCLLLAACTTDPRPAAPTTATERTVPPGILAAVPFQNRLDVAQGIFQLKLYNGTAEALTVEAVQLVWDGFTTPVARRTNRLAAGDRIDFPVPLAEARCAGDGTAADMPDPDAAVARLTLADGRTVEAPVFDVKHFARALYLTDCERQHIAATVDVAWVDLHEAERTDVTIDGQTFAALPLTAGTLRLTRRPGTEPDAVITVMAVSSTIIFAPELDAPGGAAVLPAGRASVDVPVRFVESRCDAHARSEASQPFEFVLRIDLGDGIERPYAVRPDAPDQAPMRERADRACDLRGDSGFVGQ